MIKIIKIVKIELKVISYTYDYDIIRFKSLYTPLALKNYITHISFQNAMLYTSKYSEKIKSQTINIT